MAVFAWNILYSWVKGPVAATNPWGSRTLEWMLPSPVPLENFELPVVVNGGPYDYGVGAGRQMGTPVMAGGAVDTLEAQALRMHEHFHEHEVAERPGRARVGVGLWILQDIMLVLALLVGFIYLSGLNTQHAFHPKSEPMPSSGLSWLIVVIAFAGAAVWHWGHVRSKAGDTAGGRAGLTLGWMLTIAGIVVDIVLFAGLKAPSPLHAYASGVGMFVFYHAWHLIIALAVTSIVLVMAIRGRLAGHEHLSEVVGWWLWWAAIASFLATGLIALMG